MDRTSTLSLLQRRFVIAALKNRRPVSPSEKTLNLIKDFASSFRIIDGVPSEIQSVSLN